MLTLPELALHLAKLFDCGVVLQYKLGNPQVKLVCIRQITSSYSEKLAWPGKFGAQALK